MEKYGYNLQVSDRIRMENIISSDMENAINLEGFIKTWHLLLRDVFGSKIRVKWRIRAIPRNSFKAILLADIELGSYRQSKRAPRNNGKSWKNIIMMKSHS